MTVRDQLASLIRTWVPIGVGFLLALLARKLDIVIDEGSSAALTSGVAALVSAVFYGIVRILEARWKPVGWLLGLAVRPQYEPKAVGAGSTSPGPENGADGVPKLNL